jgi:putative ABC transport system permease protein
MGPLRQDLRFAFRTLMRTPGFTAVAVLTLSLGIGGTTAMFSLVDGVLLRDLPFSESERLVTVWEDHRAVGGPIDEWTSPPTFRDWRNAEASLSGLAAVTDLQPTLLTGDRPRPLTGAGVTGEYFSVLQASLALGRGFTAEESQPGGPPAAVLSHRIWRQVFGSDPAILGRAIDVDGAPIMVVGIAGPDFRGPLIDADIWLPLVQAVSPACWDHRGCITVRTLGRLRPGASPEQATEELAGITLRIAENNPATHGDVGVTLIPLHDRLVGGVRPALLTLLAAVGFVLLITCVNLAGLLVARAARRQSEMAIRSALGAPRGRLFRQLLTESVLLAVFGGAGALLVVLWGVDFLVALLPPNLLALNTISVDGRLLAVAALLTVATGVAFGFLPALFATGHSLTTSRARAGHGQSGRRLRAVFLTAQVAMALTLLVGAGLLLRSLINVQSQDPGFRSDGIATAALALPAGRYPAATDVAAFFQRLSERLEADGRVADFSGVSSLPLVQGDMDVSFTTEADAARPETDRTPAVWYRQTLPDYFSLMGIRVVAGRALERQDAAGAPLVVVVNEEFVRRHIPSGDAIGQRLKFGRPGADSPWRTIVGVTADVRHRGLDQPVQAELFLPFAQAPSPFMFLTLRTVSGAAGGATVLREHLAALDPALPLDDVATLDERVAVSLGPRRVAAGLLTGFAGFALILTAIGLYGVVASMVGQRTREIGVRMALGATRRDVLRLVMGQGLRLTAAGIVLGGIAALALARLVTALLYGVTPTDAVTFLGVALVLGGAAALATYLPARRAAQLQPMNVLRAD